MAKIKTIKPLIKTMKPLLGPTPGSQRSRDEHRVKQEPWRRWYRIARWQKLRMKIFVRDLFTCQMCKRIEPDTSQLCVTTSKCMAAMSACSGMRTICNAFARPVTMARNSAKTIRRGSIDDRGGGFDPKTASSAYPPSPHSHIFFGEVKFVKS